ncbi:DHS-like NAD/FAD-binding domain-containing protein [Halenospora varia]|nr:DHS-like NAD/FAD-binding domain-containing protein [Halenospora varia]
MGQENSHEQIDPDTPPRTLTSRTIEGIAEYIKDGRPKRIVVMTGAGISTSAGIPDFRSPDTGLYANLARLDLPYAEAVFDISYFRQHPEPFYVLAKELYPGQFFPTVAHSFVALLDEKFMLEMLFTQNIDCLERRAGVPDEKVVEAHGSFATQRCIECKTEFPDDEMMKAVKSATVPHCIVPQCNGLVKPDIVFFGEPLPERFHQNRHVPGMADLVIVMGTSLTVHPFASLPQFAGEGVPRVLINKEKVGDFGSRPDDVVILGDCDEGVRKLADALGWRDELEGLWLEVGGKVKETEAQRLKEARKNMSKDEALEAEIEELTKEVDASLQLSSDHTERTNTLLQKDKGDKATKSTESSTGVINTPQDSNESSQTSSPPSLLGDDPRPRSVAGWKEPPPTPAVASNTPINTERLDQETPAQSPKVGAGAILDVTLPQNMPDASPGEEGKKSGSRI